SRFTAARAALAIEQSDQALTWLKPVLTHQTETLEPGDPQLLETLRLTADIHQQAGDMQAELTRRQQVAEQLTGSKESPGAENISSALRLLELYQSNGEVKRTEPLLGDIERWLRTGGEELDELRERYRQADAKKVGNV
ncbi:MAG TPA: hypothetical protein VK972_03050, partial [Wenzhouxiangella sp.]|nr:hypothetical protein [Wenzhouxiangella sp.]